MIKLFQQFIKESDDLLIPRNLDGRLDKYLRNLQRKLDSCNGIWEGDLDLRKIEIPSWFSIPDNLHVSGEIDLSYSNISQLPKNLQCKDISLYSCKNIKTLSESLKVEYIINLSKSSIERLPKNLQCKDLYLRYCENLKELPEGLNVKFLHIKGSGLTKKYCERMKQEGKISYNYLYA